ncbi:MULTISPECIES: ABC transporter substrate-binding protein [unclassified Acidisoma]|jgi:ribose transport system substrate-binding protein|uniref:ABC transporter substrate-binding protein n=1 Tax=unclassified Acidisoma TaxID=2634065 RepID=UPI001C202380|nr:MULTISPECIES: ABC transporter substrate-binding protein [unclassified Acidisoma]
MRSMLQASGVALLVGLCSTSIAFAAAGVATGDTSKKRIALTDGFSSNSWEQSAWNAWKAVASRAVKDGVIGEQKIITGNDDPAQQITQMQNLILEGYDAIVVDAASPTALNGTIKEACDAGIVVVIYDSLATEPCAIKVNVDYKDYGVQETHYMAQALGEKGNFLEIRGVAGSEVDIDISAGINETLKQYPNMHKVGTVYGNWDGTIAQRQVATVLPTLPQIDGVLTQGGDGYGSLQAFKAAGRKIPTIIMGNRQDELAVWKEMRDKDGYKTFSISSAPGMSTIAFWTAQQILAGKKVPNTFYVPLLAIRENTLDSWLAATPVGTAASPQYTLKDTVELIDDNLAGVKPKDLPQPKLPQ